MIKNFFILFFLTSLLVTEVNAQIFGEIQEVKPVGEYLFPIGAKPLIISSFDVKDKYEFSYNELVPTVGPISFWEELNQFTLDFSEVAFVNWNAGGSNSVSGLYGMNIKRLFRKNALRWNNEFRFRFGVNKQEDQELRKTEDELEIISTFGYQFSKESNWFYSAKFNYRTQIAPGYNYPDKDNSISGFMAPGYVFLGAGAKYTLPDESFEMYLSPITQKSTFVLNQRLANDGAFGVEAAIRDEEGNIIREGKTSRNEFGILVTNEFTKEIFDNVNAISRLSLYSDYINNFGNIDVDWELNFNFKINEFMKANFGSHIRYDDDIKIKEENANGNLVQKGARIQWKQQLGIGVIVEL
ncbi:DUF3078 domain-containing protein [Psychroflexus aestuariivivens]|uniref:DUF3078 domain-containing protein n=1 Tax=Psychroflexus aestuariivivens TaxID=1795040 RepID=UPI000FDBBAF4|nr:DUF3078 domain-containing protein [Psychroflexus aestuariivivens]